MCGGVCVGGGGRAFYYTYIYNGKRQSCEGAEQVGVLVAETIHPACMCEGGGRGGREVVTPSDLKMQLENGLADERSKGECGAGEGLNWAQ